MESEKSPSKTISVTLCPQDYARLSQLAEHSGRTRPGYLRWLLHRHLEALGGSGASGKIPNS